MGRIRVAALAAAAVMLVPVAGAQAKPRHHHHHGHDRGSAQLEKAVSVRNIVKHQKALQSIADMNGGTRHTETPGYTASVAYVKERMQRAGLDVKVVQFNFPEWQETAPPVFQQLTPTAKTYTPGDRGRRQQPGRRLHHVRELADEGHPERPGGAGQRHRHREPGGRHEHRRL